MVLKSVLGFSFGKALYVAETLLGKLYFRIRALIVFLQQKNPLALALMHFSLTEI